MHADYYLNTIYPLQDKILSIIASLPVGFYLTGGTALSRAFLHHRFSDDLDFFINAAPDFQEQVELVVKSFKNSGITYETMVADQDFARLNIQVRDDSLKLDFVNDVPFRHGKPVNTPLFIRTDNILNILSNKITALGRYSPKDVVDIVFISKGFTFNWENILNDAFEKDMWANPITTAEVLEGFPVEKLHEINWISETPEFPKFSNALRRIISDIILGNENSLYLGG